MSDVLKFQTLIDAAAEWKAQFENEPLELAWKVDLSGMLYLNGFWVCPYKFITRVEVHDMGIDLWLSCSLLTIIIAQSECSGQRYIKCFERDVFNKFQQSSRFPERAVKVPSYHGVCCAADKKGCRMCDFALQCYPEWRPTVSRPEKAEWKYFNRPGGRRGTCYYEFYAGKWDGKTFWKDTSLCLDEDLFDRLSFQQLFVVAAPTFDPFGPTEIHQKEWSAFYQMAQYRGGETLNAANELRRWAEPVLQRHGCFTILGV